MPADSFMFDDEAFETDVERIAREWVASEDHRANVEAAAEKAIVELRRSMTAVAHARARGIDSRPLEDDARRSLSQLGPDVWFRVAVVQAWEGGLSAQEMAKREATEFSNTYTPPMLPTEDWA